MKIALTGSTGFIGRSVLAEFQRRGLEVTAGARDVSRLPKNFLHNGVKVELESQNPFELLGSPDVVLHLAWGGLPNYKSLSHFENELPRQYLFLKRLVKSGLQSLVVTGTCQEYGMQSGALSTKQPAAPNTPYAFAKDALRQQMEFLRAKTRFSFTWARLFYMFGKGQAKESLYTQLRKAVAAGQTKFDMSGGEQLRDYLPVETVAERLVDLTLQGANGAIVNICSGKPVAIRDLVQQWIDQNGWAIKPNLGQYPYPDYEPMEFWGCP